MATSSRDSMMTIEKFINRVGNTKVAEANTEPGSIGGETSHPVKDVDDHTEEATEGERSKENTADVKKDQGAASVDSTSEATAKVGSVVSQFAKGQLKKANPFTRNVKKAEGGTVSTEGSAADDAEPSVLNPQPTGKTPDIETSSAKGGKEDPGSSHPARTDNDSLDDHKYAADADPIKIAADMKELGERLCAQISWISDALGNSHTAEVAQKRAGDKQMQHVQKQGAAQLDPHIQMQLGWEMAGLINGTMDKQAADRMVQEAIEQVILSGTQRAVKVAEYLDNFFAAHEQAQKQAEGEVPGGAMPPMDPSVMAGGDPAAGGGDPAAMGGQPPMGGDGGEDAMMAALGGGAGAGGPEGGAGGGGGGEIDAQQLASFLDELGVTPEELEQALAEESSGGDPSGLGGGDPSAVGPAGPPPGGMGGGGEKPASDRGRQHAQKNAAAKQGDYRAGMRDYLTELLNRSRRRAS